MGVGSRGEPENSRSARNARPRLDQSVRQGAVRLRHAGHDLHLPRLTLLRDRIGRERPSDVAGLSPEAALHARHNFQRGVLNGVMFTLVEAFIAPSLTLAWFVSRLGAPNIVVGLLPAILSGGWFLPQILVAGRVQGLPHVMHWYRRVGIFRTVCMALLTLASIALAGEPVILLALFFLLYILYSFSAGVSGLPWLEIVGKVVPPRRRGNFFGLRSFWGSMLALLAAGPIAAILSEDLLGLTFPYNFALLFGLATVGVAIGVWAWSSIKEPPATTLGSPITVRQLLRRGREALGTDRDYRSFMVARILVSLAAIADPFYIIYARTELNAPPATIGLYLGALSGSSLLSNFLWSPLADRAGNRTLMTWTVISVGIVPLMALFFSLFIGLVDNSFLFTGFASVFILSGLALGAGRIVNNNMMLSIAPPAERPTYVAFLNLVLGVVIFVPVLGGALIDVFGFRLLFVISALTSALAMFATARMSTRRAE